MIRAIVLLLVSALQLHAAWTACDTGGRSVSLRQDAGDIVTLLFPGPNKVPLRVAFLVTPCPSLTGHTLTATFFIAATAPSYVGANAGGCIVPVNLRLYFTTTTGSYKVSNADRNPSQYWWSRTTSALIEQVDDGALVTLSCPLNPVQWSHANGGLGENLVAEFNAAAANARQVGFSFGGGCYFDTGVGMSSGSATMHVLSFGVQ